MHKFYPLCVTAELNLPIYFIIIIFIGNWAMCEFRPRQMVFFQSQNNFVCVSKTLIEKKIPLRRHYKLHESELSTENGDDDGDSKKTPPLQFDHKNETFNNRGKSRTCSRNRTIQRLSLISPRLYYSPYFTHSRCACVCGRKVSRVSPRA